MFIVVFAEFMGDPPEARTAENVFHVSRRAAWRWIIAITRRSRWIVTSSKRAIFRWLAQSCVDHAPGLHARAGSRFFIVDRLPDADCWFSRGWLQHCRGRFLVFRAGAGTIRQKPDLSAGHRDRSRHHLPRAWCFFVGRALVRTPGNHCFRHFAAAGLKVPMSCFRILASHIPATTHLLIKT